MRKDEIRPEDRLTSYEQDVIRVFELEQMTDEERQELLEQDLAKALNTIPQSEVYNSLILRLLAARLKKGEDLGIIFDLRHHPQMKKFPLVIVALRNNDLHSLKVGIQTIAEIKRKKQKPA